MRIERALAQFIVRVIYVGSCKKSSVVEETNKCNILNMEAYLKLKLKFVLRVPTRLFSVRFAHENALDIVAIRPIYSASQPISTKRCRLNDINWCETSSRGIISGSSTGPSSRRKDLLTNTVARCSSPENSTEVDLAMFLLSQKCCPENMSNFRVTQR